MLWAATPRQLILWGWDGGSHRVGGCALPAFGVYRCNFVEISVTSLDCSVLVVRFSDGRRIQFPEWAFEFFCPVNVVTNHNRSAGFPIQVYGVSFRFGVCSPRRVGLRNFLAKSGGRQNRRRQDQAEAYQCCKRDFRNLNHETAIGSPRRRNHHRQQLFQGL